MQLPTLYFLKTQRCPPLTEPWGVSILLEIQLAHNEPIDIDNGWQNIMCYQLASVSNLGPLILF